MVPHERVSERICEQIVDAPVSHSQPQILKEVVEVVKAGEQIDDDIVPVDQPGDGTTVAKSVDEARPPGFVMHCAMSESESEVDSSGEDSSDKNVLTLLLKSVVDGIVN